MTPERKITPEMLELTGEFEIGILQQGEDGIYPHIKEGVRPVVKTTSLSNEFSSYKNPFCDFEEHPRNATLLTSSATEPAIILEDNASFCHAPLSLGKNRDVFAYHTQSFSSPKREQQAKTHMNKNPQLKKRTMIVTGLHNSTDPEGEVARLKDVYHDTTKVITPPIPTQGFIYIPPEISITQKPIILLIPSDEEISTSELFTPTKILLENSLNKKRF